MTDHDTAAVLTEAEREDFLRNLRQNLGYRAFVIEDTMLAHVERIAAGAVARLAAQPPQDDPLSDNRERTAVVLGEGHLIFNGANGRVTCTCNPMPWMTFEEYAAHLVAALAEPTPGSEAG